MARLFHLSRTTITRKIICLGLRSEKILDEFNKSRPLAESVEFDDMETFEHTKYKPLSITIAVESKTRRILGVEVARFPPKGLLAKKGFKKYGPRRDERALARERLFQRIKPLIHPNALIKSDENPFYVKDVARHFPLAKYERHRGQRGSIVGQGELKKVRFDPLFSLNHSAAMLRANMNRLFRKTWCTTKLPERLKLHIAIYAVFHNLTLIDSS
jgi:hypothetical protein